MRAKIVKIVKNAVIIGSAGAAGYFSGNPAAGVVVVDILKDLFQ